MTPVLFSDPIFLRPKSFAFFEIQKQVETRNTKYVKNRYPRCIW